MLKYLFILSAVLALNTTATAGEPPALVAKQKCQVCGDDCRCKPGDCPGKCPVKSKGGVTAAYAAVAKGEKVTLCVGVACIDGAYATDSIKGYADGVYDCYKAKDGAHLMQIRHTVAVSACSGGSCSAGYPASFYGFANPKSVFDAPCAGGNCPAPSSRRR